MEVTYFVKGAEPLPKMPKPPHKYSLLLSPGQFGRLYEVKCRQRVPTIEGFRGRSG